MVKHRVVFIGEVEPQASAVENVLWDSEAVDAVWPIRDPYNVGWLPRSVQPSLIVVAGYRRLIPPEVLAIAPTVGFHSAKLPEYPGRAPVPWTLLRGDDYAYNTMLYLDEGIDSGDIIDEERYWIRPGDQPEDLYRWIAESDVRLLRKHLPGLLDGTAPRTPQDPSRRGPLTSKDGWARLAEMYRLATGHA